MKRRHSVNNPAIGQRVLQARTAAGISQRELSSKTVYTAAYLSRIENGDRTPSLAVLRAYAPVLNVTAAWLETGRDDVEVIIPRHLAEQLVDQCDNRDLVSALMQALHTEPEVIIGLA